jgi:hypothetical protein
MSAPAPLTARDRQFVRASLLELSRACSRVVLSAMASPTAASVGSRWSESESNLPSRFGVGLYKSACNSIALSVTAAADHVDTFVISLSNENSAVAKAALTRAAIEAYGRAYFLLDSKSDTEFYYRYLSLTYEELKFPVRHSGFATGDGVEIDGVAYRAEIAESARKVGLDKFLDVGLAGLVSKVLQRLVEGEVDPAIYSQLSGVSHGTASAVGMFVQRPSSGVKLIFPRDIALEYTGYIYAATANVADLAIEVFDPAAGIVDRWIAARDRASVALSDLQETI